MVCGRWVGGGLLGVGVVLCGVFYFGFRSGIVCVGDLLGLPGVQISAWMCC